VEPVELVEPVKLVELELEDGVLVGLELPLVPLHAATKMSSRPPDAWRSVFGIIS
jgi:hypothetical protein